jgi:DNA-binding NarL/FixJ family response regulator
VSRIRVVLTQLPPMQYDIVRNALESEPDMEVIGDLVEADQLGHAVEGACADVVVLGARDSALPALGIQLLYRYPHVNVLTLTPDGRHAFLYQIRPHQTVVEDVSSRGLLEAIRAGVRAEVG